MAEHLRELLSEAAAEVLPLTAGAAVRLPAEAARKIVVESVHHETAEYSVFRPAKPVSRFLSKAVLARCAVRSQP